LYFNEMYDGIYLIIRFLIEIIIKLMINVRK
jgi:hypothetical protein